MFMQSYIFLCVCCIWRGRCLVTIISLRIAVRKSVMVLTVIEVLIWFEFLLGINPHAVRKRTPRVPVSYSCRRDDTESYIPPNKSVKKSEVDDNDDEHVAALTLTGASQRVGPPHVSQPPDRRAGRRRSSPVQSYDRMVNDF